MINGQKPDPQVLTIPPGDSAWTCTSYDGRGRVSQVIDTSGATAVSNNYTGGNLASTIRDSAGGTHTTVENTDLLGRTTSYTDEQGGVTRSVYDQAGRLTDTYRTLPGGTETHLASYAYDDANRLQGRTEYVSNPSGAGTLYTYDSAGRPSNVNLGTSPGVVTTDTYDANHGWLTGITHVRGATTLASENYNRSLASKITGELANVNGTTTKWLSYGYDQAGRLTDVGGTATRSYRYDNNTNRCNTTTTSCDGTSTGSYLYNNADQLTTSPFGSGYIYDTHGNLTNYNTAGGTVTIGYDRFDHATTITTTGTGASTVTETLAPSGRVIRRQVTGANSEDTDYGYADNSDSLAWTRPHTGGTVTTYLDQLIITGTTPAYELTNAHGDILGTVDASGTLTPYPVTDEFGVGTVSSTRLGWLGKQDRFTIAQSLGLIRMGVRLYDPTVGRFLEPDPVEGGSANNYDYVSGDPINGFDLGGLCRTHHRGWWGYVRSFRCRATHAMRRWENRTYPHWYIRAERHAVNRVKHSLLHPWAPSSQPGYLGTAWVYRSAILWGIWNAIDWFLEGSRESGATIHYRLRW